MTEADLLKQEILDKTRQYYNVVHKPAQQKPFVAGDSRIPYAGRVFDENELTNLIDSSLEFWLTTGR